MNAQQYTAQYQDDKGHIATVEKTRYKGECPECGSAKATYETGLFVRCDFDSRLVGCSNLQINCPDCEYYEFVDTSAPQPPTH